MSVVPVQDSVIDQLHELIFEYLNIHAHTVGFPELALPILMEVHNVMSMLLFCSLLCFILLMIEVTRCQKHLVKWACRQKLL